MAGRPSNTRLFLEALERLGSRATNPQLMTELGWESGKYWRTRDLLYDQGEVEKGRGRGGTVVRILKAREADANSSSCLNLDAAAMSPTPPVGSSEDLSEDKLYEPVCAVLDKHWKLVRSLDETSVDNIARQGKRDTGGSWSRPDIAVTCFRTFEYLPDRLFEIHTFEVKPSYDVSVKGVMEALTHRQFSARSIVLYHTSGREFNDYPESLRIQNLASTHGVGVWIARSINDFSSWEEITPALRNNPDPEDVETFIKRSLSDSTKSSIRKWMK